MFRIIYWDVKSGDPLMITTHEGSLDQSRAEVKASLLRLGWETSFENDSECEYRENGDVKYLATFEDAS